MLTCAPIDTSSSNTASALVENLRQKFSLGKPMTPGNAKAVGCLLILLFAFGFFFNQSIGLQGPKIPFLERNTAALSPAAAFAHQAAPSQGRFAELHQKTSARDNGQLSFDRERGSGSDGQQQAFEKLSTSPASLSARHYEPSAKESFSMSQFGGAARHTKIGQPRSWGGRVMKHEGAAPRPRADQSPLHSWPAGGAGRRLLEVDEAAPESPPSVVPGEFFPESPEFASGGSAANASLHQAPASSGASTATALLNNNVTFFMCTDVNRLIPQVPAEAEHMFRGDPFVVLFVPPTDQHGQVLPDATSALQFTCRVVDVTSAPIMGRAQEALPSNNETNTAANTPNEHSLPISINFSM